MSHNEAGRRADGKAQLAWLPAVDGFVVGSFKTPRHMAFVVSQLDSPAFRELAQILVDPVSHRLAGARRNNSPRCGDSRSE